MSSSSPSSTDPSRKPNAKIVRLQRFALGISILSILYNAAEGAVSVALGFDSKSRSLIFFGIQSAIEVASACIVTWRFARPADQAGRGEGDAEKEARNLR